MCSRSVHDNFTTGSGRHDDTEGADGAQRMTKNCSTARMSRSGVSVVCEARNRTGSRRTGARRRRFPKISPSSLVGCSSGAPASGYQDDVAMGASPKRLAEHCHVVGIALLTPSERRARDIKCGEELAERSTTRNNEVGRGPCLRRASDYTLRHFPRRRSARLAGHRDRDVERLIWSPGAGT